MGSLLRTIGERVYRVHKSHHDDLRGFPQPPGCFFVKASWRRSHHSRLWPRSRSTTTTTTTQPTMDTQFLAQGGLLETLTDHFDIENTSSIDNNWMKVEMDLTNESTMTLFQELEEVEEVKEEETTADSALLSNLISSCGIPSEQEATTFPCSPANSMNSDMETHQNLIEELEDFFGSPTILGTEEGSRGLDPVTKTSVTAKSPNSILEALASGEVYMPNDQEFTLTEEALKGAVSTTCVTEDGQNVIIIVAPPSPAHSNSSPAHSNFYASDTDPEWVPSPCSSVSPSSPLRTIATESRTLKKKYQRKKPPTAPTGPYPVEKRERKKGEQNTVEDELELLALKNTELRAQLTKMETEAKFLKKMMTESGLGRIASTMRL